jgi:peptidoglycan/xylan/chitin deacetylase (PgdA/CDA1 family)
MKKLFCFMFLILLTVSFAGCGEEKKSGDVNQIPTEVADDKKDKPKPTEPAPDAQSGKDYILAADDLSNLQLDDPTKPVYDKYIIWERQEKGLPIALPDLEPYNAESMVYLTFDDGPDDKITPQVLDILRDEGVKATFYVCGNMVDTYPDVLKRMFNEGHAIGNHSYNHRYDEIYKSPWSFMEQVIQTDTAIRNVIGVRPFIVRAPGGVGMFSANYWTMIEDCGYVEHDWNVLTEDATPSKPNASTQINNVLKYLGDNPPNSVIILMHCNSDKVETVKALPEIIHFCAIGDINSA